MKVKGLKSISSKHFGKCDLEFGEPIELSSTFTFNPDDWEPEFTLHIDEILSALSKEHLVCLKEAIEEKLSE